MFIAVSNKYHDQGNVPKEGFIGLIILSTCIDVHLHTLTQDYTHRYIYSVCVGGGSGVKYELSMPEALGSISKFPSPKKALQLGT